MTNIVTKWIKTGKVHDFVFLGKDVIASATGNYVIFHNLSTKEQKIEYFNSASRGEGASCLAGHPVIPVFSTAERCCKPKIYIHTYPGIKKVAECKLNEFIDSYLSCCFTGTEYLLSLTSSPNLQLVVWMWRSGQKMTHIDADLGNNFQVIEAAHSSHLIYQFAPNQGKLLLYEIHAHSNNVTIIKNDVKSIKNKIICVCWTKNNDLLLSDEFKNVFILSSDGKKSQMILRGSTDVNIDNQFTLLPFYAGFVIADEKLELAYYNKSFTENNSCHDWNVTWRIKCESQPLKMTLARHKEAILVYCVNGKVLELRLTHDFKPKFEEIINDGENFDYLVLLKPQESHCVLASRSSNCLRILNILDGNFGTEYVLSKTDRVTGLAVHPNLPLLAACTDSGKSIYFTAQEKKIEMLKTIHLQREPFNNIKFSASGCFLGIVSTISNNFFLINTLKNHSINVFTYLSMKSFVLDFLIYDSNSKQITIIALIKSSSKKLVGNCIEIISMINLHENVCKTHKIYMPNYYQNLHYSIQNGFDFLSIPYLKKQLHLFKIQKNYESLELINVISSEHKLRKFDVYTSKLCTLTSGYDGFIKINSDSFKTTKTQMVHHWRENGVKHSVISDKNGMIIALGKNGSIIGLQITEFRKESDNRFLQNQNDFVTGLRSCKEENLFPPDLNYTWLEQRSLKEYEKIKNATALVKTLILQDFTKLKTKIKYLLDMNETKSSECQLEISTFDLNIGERKKKIETNLLNCNKKEAQIKEIIIKKQLIIDYLMKKYLNTMKTHDCALISFGCEIQVNNFSLAFAESESVYDSSIVLFDTPLNSSHNRHVENKEYSTIKLSVIENMVHKPSKNLNDCLTLHYAASISFSGSTSCKWIDDDYSKTISNDHDDKQREYKLKSYFNEEFEKMTILKKLVLKNITDCISQLTHCKNELNIMFNIPFENKTENVITIINEDISLESKINNDSNVTDEKVINVPEKIKIKSFDELNFRKEKLDDMMDGTLEIRWEDEVKKDIAKPNCLLLKNPVLYDADDKKLIKAYREKVKELEELRIKYRNHLESEVCRLSRKIETEIQNFNEKLEVFALKKILVKSAVLQEFLLRLRKQKTQYLKEYGNKQISSIKNNELTLIDENHTKLTREIAVVESELVESRNKFENLCKRDKILEGKFKTEFSELKQPLVDHLLRQYKRRPKISKITCASLTFLSEANKCLMAGKKSLILPQEYLEFLRGMDALDVMPNSLPPQIDASHWNPLCKLRRSKVEVEIKLRIASLEVAETEETFFHLQKLISLNQSKLLSVKNTIEEETLKQSRSLENPEVQLVLKSAQIEISTSGYSSDFKNASLVSCRQLVHVNDDINNKGSQKINVMRALMDLKKSVLLNNWKCQFMQKKLTYLKSELVNLRNTKLSKNMRNYLVERLEKNVRFKDVLSCERMLKSVNKKFQRMKHEQESNLSKVIIEINHWKKVNSILNKKSESISLKQREELIALENHSLRKRNQEYHKKIITLMMERTRLIEKIKKNYDELAILQAQLELLKLKTYPVLHRNYYFIKD